MKLELWMVKQGLGYEAAARLFHIKRQQIFSYVKKKEGRPPIIPSIENMRKIYEGTNHEVTPLDFYLEPDDVTKFYLEILEKADAADDGNEV